MSQCYNDDLSDGDGEDSDFKKACRLSLLGKSYLLMMPLLLLTMMMMMMMMSYLLTIML